MNLRPTYVFETMASTGINGINPGRMILVGESLEKNTGIFIVNKDTSGLTAQTTIQQALDGKYLLMLNKKTDEDFGQFTFDNISTVNPQIVGGMKLGMTWLNTTTGELFISANKNGIMGWQGNKGTEIFKEPMYAKTGFLATTNTLEGIDKKDFFQYWNEWWDIHQNKKIKDGTGIITEKDKLSINQMWVATNYPFPMQKALIQEEEEIATKYLNSSGIPARMITNARAYTYYYQPQVDWLLNWTFGSYGYVDKDYIGVEPAPTKPEVAPTDTTRSIEMEMVVFQLCETPNFANGSVAGSGGPNTSFYAKKGTYKLHDNFLCPCYKLGLHKDGVAWIKKNAGKIIYVHNVLPIGNTNSLISPLEYWTNYVY